MSNVTGWAATSREERLEAIMEDTSLLDDIAVYVEDATSRIVALERDRADLRRELEEERRWSSRHLDEFGNGRK